MTVSLRRYTCQKILPLALGADMLVSQMLACDWLERVDSQGCHFKLI